MKPLTIRIASALVLLLLTRCASAKPITVEQLKQLIGLAAANHKSNADTARKVAALEMAERISEDTLASLQARAPGPQTAATLEELVGESAFLDLPVSELPHDAPPGIDEQRQILARAANYAARYAHVRRLGFQAPQAMPSDQPSLAQPAQEDLHPRAEGLLGLLFPPPKPLPFVTPAPPGLTTKQQSAPPAAQPIFRQRVEVVTVPVVVRGTEGKCISGLSKDDFELFDNGKRQVISDFVEEHFASSKSASGTPGANVLPSAPMRYVAYLFDDVHLDAGDLAQTRAALKRALPPVLDPSTSIAILSTSGRTAAGFTIDRNRLIDGLNKLHPNPLSSPHATCPEMGYYEADRIVNLEDDEALNAVIQDAIASCGLNTGPKEMVRETARTMALPAARQVVATHHYETRAALRSIENVVRFMAKLPGERTLVLISPGFLTTIDVQGMGQIEDLAARSGVVINALDARGLYVAAGLDAAESRPLSGRRYDRRQELVQSTPLRELADATGGIFFQNSNDYDAGFRRVSGQPSTEYVLGFSPQNKEKDKHFHNLKVALKDRKGVEIQARRGYFSMKAIPGG